MTLTSDRGECGERAAVDFLRANGYLIMETNWRSGHYELDVIAEKGDAIHFIEVKYRKAGGLTLPEDAMTKSKVKSLLKAANHYVTAHAIELDCYMDLIAVDAYPDGTLGIRLIPDAANIRW